MATIAQCARHLDISERRFKELLDEGVIERQDIGAYDVDIVREEYIGHLRKVAAGRQTAPGALDPAQERARKDSELADAAALKNAVTRGELVSAAQAEAAWIAQVGIARERLLAMPSKLGPRVVAMRTAAEVQGAIEAEVHAALAELAAVRVQAPDDPGAGGSGGQG